jgi:psp operon transcriptional activator
MPEASHERLIGEAPCWLQVLEEISQIAPLEKPVLLVGERGTGKENVAARLHYLSNRWEGTFLKMNCAAITETLLETELFGHEAGAFTGASRTHHGRFERADGGTLFLDELASTSSLVQEKLLRVIEYGEFERVGGTRTLTTDVRLVAATNEDLPTLADTGRFRHDLLDRLAFDVITLPPLRERGEDIPLLAAYFAVNMATELGRDLFPGFTAEAMAVLVHHGWPGNVRELKNVVERAVYRTDAEEEVNEIILDPFASPYRVGIAKSGEQATEAAADKEATVSFPVDLKERVQEFETQMIQHALEESRYNQRRAAELLGLTYHQLRGYLRKYELVGSETQ